MSLFDGRIAPGGLCRSGAARPPYSGRGRVARALGALCLAVVLGCAGAATAGAREARLFAGSFGSAASSTPDPYPLSKPSGVAVDDASHDVYVTDPGNHRVEKFTAGGEFLLAFGANVGGPGIDVCGGLIVCEPGTPGSAPGELTTPEHVAVDNSTGPSAGDVYVADTSDDLVSKFNSSGELITSWGVDGQLDGSTVMSPPERWPGPFEKLGPIAVDPAGNLWVESIAASVGLLTRPHIFEFAQNDAPVSDLQIEVGQFLNAIAVDAKGDVYADMEGAAFAFSSTGAEIGVIHAYLYGSFHAESLALDLLPDEQRDIYLGITNEIAFYESSCAPAHNEECKPAEFFGADQLKGNNVSGLAVDSSSGAVYAVLSNNAAVTSFVTAVVPDVVTSAPSSETSTSVTLNGTVDPDGVLLKEGLEGCRFEWGETSSYGHVAACNESAGQIGSGSGPVEVHATLGVVAGRTYHFRLVAGNANDVNGHLDEPTFGGDVAFGPPVIDSESVTEVTSGDASLQGLVDPGNAATQTYIEYGLEDSYGQSTQVVDLSAAEGQDSILQHLHGLTPDTTYHYRVVAENVFGTVQGEDHAFTTQPASSGQALPDGRAWELVTPPDKHGATLYNPGPPGLLQASVNGDELTAPFTVSTEHAAAGQAESTQVLSVRGAEGGWSSRDISVPHATPVGVPGGGKGLEYRAFSPDLAESIVEPDGLFTSLAPEVAPLDTERTPYVRHDVTCGSEPETCYTPIATGAEGFADVTSGLAFGHEPPSHQFEEGVTGYVTSGGYVNFVGASADMSRVIVSSKVQLTTASTPAGVNELYEWSAQAPPTERLRLISVNENGEPSPTEATLGAARGDYSGDKRNAVAADGSLVFWTKEEGTGGLYMWDASTGASIRLDVPEQGVTGGGAVGPIFQGASADGSRVFFTDAQRLTSNSGAAENKPDLYVCTIVEGNGGPVCELEDLTPAGNGESANVIGTVGAISNDGTWVYFVADGVLGGAGGEGARTGDCAEESPMGATCNLYVLHHGEAGWEPARLIAVLSGDDYPDWGGADYAILNAELTVGASPDGAWFVFMSDRSLTGYDNLDARTEKPDEEAFVYHALAGERGSLACVSCDPTGARPEGVEYSQIAEGLTGGNGDVWPGEQGLAATLPGWEEYGRNSSLYQPRFVLDSGRVFFNALDALVAQDTNGNASVYEYEPVGVGGAAGCQTASSTYVAGESGCVALISSGTAAGESVFVDGSETGDDVFFETTARLTGQDIDNALDVYDAHVCTAESPCLAEQPASPACTTADACRAAPSPQPEVFGAPASAMFTGNGNLTPASAPKRKATVGKKTHAGKRKRRRAGKHSARRRGRHRKPKTRRKK